MMCQSAYVRRTLAALWVAAAAAAFAVAPASSQPRDYQKSVAPGVTLFEHVDESTPVVICGVKVDTRVPGVHLGASVANDRTGSSKREIVSSAVERRGAVAGINADFFPWTADPLGMVAIDGRLISEPSSGWASFGVTRDGKPLLGMAQMALTFHVDNGRMLKVDSIDRPAEQGVLNVYDRYYGPSTGAREKAAEAVLTMDWAELLRTGSAEAAIKEVIPEARNTRIPGDGIVMVAKGPRIREMLDAMQGQQTAHVKLVLRDEDGESWLGLYNCVGGAQWLVKNGTLYGSEAKGTGVFDKETFVQHRHPRTAVGVTKNGYIVLAILDGRQKTSRGASLKEMAQAMLDQGCVKAINLDGGGSSVLIARGLVVNSPSDGQQRPVASQLLVFSDGAAKDPGEPLTVTPSATNVVAGEKLLLRLSLPDGQPVKESQMSSVLWGTRNGGGFVEQNGEFIALRAGNPAILAWLDGSSGETQVAVSPAGPGVIDLAWDDSTPATAASRVLNITVTDSLDNANPFAVVALKVTGGKADSTEVKCGPDGVGKATITWDASAPEADRKVEVSCGQVSASTNNQ